ncbi:hypothetical protein [Nocardioides sp. URHA0020]|uniref:hypothetical protein n=1 Tax=Nocardioides sp. URHA0020 TaxID=1380392 RepID=UPI00048EC0E4|nr:hypothetical protein [Nocardioides sp. URHA0020]
MRARLGAQREAEEMLAEASRLRGSAAADAGVIVADAEAVAADVLTEARAEAARLTAEATERADEILAQAWFDAEDLRARSAGMLQQAEDGLRQLTPNLQDAIATVTEVVGSLEQLRTGPVDGSTRAKVAVLQLASTPDTTPDTTPDIATDTAPEPSATAVDVVTVGDDVVPEGGQSTTAPDPEARPLGWLFRASHA